MQFLLWILAVYGIAAVTLALFAAGAVDGYEDDSGFHAISPDRTPSLRGPAAATAATC